MSESEDIDHDDQVSNLMPERSKKHYWKCYKQFKEWCNNNNALSVSENVLLAFLTEKSKTTKCSTLWSTYSMLKCTLNIKEGLDVRNYLKVIPFLKKKSIGYIAQKSKVFTQGQIKTFLEQANDEKYLLWKVILIMGVSGGMRRDELTKMTLDHIEERTDVLIVTVLNRKPNNYTFTITNLDYLRLYRKYVALRPKNGISRRLFLKYSQGRCYKQVVGVHTIGKIPSLIANYLKLPNSNEYTGHSFRKSSGTVSANRSSSASVPKERRDMVNFNQKITNSCLYNCRFCLKSVQDTPFKLLSTVNFVYIKLILPEIIDFRLKWKPIGLVGFTGVWRYEDVMNFELSYKLFTPIEGLQDNGVVAKLIYREGLDSELSIKLADTRDLTLVETPQICPDCLNSLENAYNFKKKCLETETQIRRITKNNKISAEIDVDDYEIFPSTNNSSNKNYKNTEKDNDMIKTVETEKTHFESQFSCSTSLSRHFQSENFPELIKNPYNFKKKNFETETQIKSLIEATKIKEEIEVSDYEIFSATNLNNEIDTKDIHDEDIKEKVNCTVTGREDPTINEEKKHNNLNKHLETTHFPKWMKNKKSELNIHEMCHRNIKHLMCSECGKYFNSANVLRKHQQIHYKGKYTICEICEEGFYQIGDFKDHYCHINIRIPSTEQPVSDPQSLRSVQKHTESKELVEGEQSIGSDVDNGRATRFKGHKRVPVY